MQKIKISQLGKLFEEAKKLKPAGSILVKGRAGIGKSSFFNSLGYRVVDIRAINYDIGDLLLKVPEGDELKNKYVEWLKSLTDVKDYTILLLDEIDKASPSIQKLFYQLVLDRKVENMKLDDKVIIVAIENTDDDGAFNLIEQDKPLYDRFLFRVELELNKDEWVEYAISKGIDKRIITFLSRFGSMLYQENQETLIATPRRWEMVSNVINDKDLNEAEFYIASAINSETAIMFKKFIEKQNKFNVEKIIYEKQSIPEKLDEQYAIISLLTDELIKVYDNDMKQFNNFVERIPKEMEAETIVLFMKFFITDYAVKKGMNRDIFKQEVFSKSKSFNKLAQYLIN